MADRPWLVLAGIALAIGAVASGWEAGYAADWRLGVGQRFDDLQFWIIDNRADHPLFTWLFRPMAIGVATGLAEIEAQLRLLGWPGVALVVGTIAVTVAGWRVAVVSLLALSGVALLGQWADAMTTLALMGVAVLISLAIGVPLGVLTGRVRTIEKVVRPVLDAMQTIPAYVYLLPLGFVFGLGNPAAIVATIIYAVPPAVRLTALGIHQVPAVKVEVGKAYGATNRQLLRTVRLPLAMPSVRVGVNQTIMMALSMVVIASLVGATGLGREVLRGLQTLDVGRALDAGLAIVLLAMLLDRITFAAGGRGRRAVRGWRTAALIAGALVVGRLLGTLPFAAEPPLAGALSVAEVTDQVFAWARIELTGVTTAFSSIVIRFALDPLHLLLTSVPWWLFAGVVAVIAWRTAGQGLAFFAVVACATIGAMGAWPNAMNTLSQVLIATVITIALAVPIGILASQSNGFDRALRPVLDGMQTLPAFVYLIPVVALFTIGRVPGLIASVIYALPPGVRMTNAGIREVEAETVEAARSQGATRWQVLRTVQLPLARPTILMGLNQTTMMVLAGVIIAGLIGAGGLGLEAIRGLTRSEIGRGAVAGISIVLLGIVLDRITQSLGEGDAEFVESQRAKMKTA
ncbi:ABC transporter permease [Nitriliruptor alkaliphilus]|uniref:ABC transporter permease n=1 Tax=Nitriliruptor alkaliphilus TaxID=427918 RepID=UPI0014708438|nr:ABC transporter permease subunit [Nitriliruptor alkaliphilus]